MKPAFALSFSENGISLHHHSDDEWYCIGTVPLDAPDFPERIQDLRDQGFALANDLSCSLIIPPDQVRLLTVETHGLEATSARQKVQETLAEATPYDLSELSYATTDCAGDTLVAAVARQTLNEAHEFAAAHGFIPDGFQVSATGEEDLAGPHLAFASDLEPLEDQPEIPAAAAPQEPSPETPEDSALPVHAIAAAPAPSAFRSAGAAAPAPRGFALETKHILLPAVAASVVLGMVAGGWWAFTSKPEQPGTELTTELAQPTVQTEIAQPEPTPQSQPVTTQVAPDSEPQIAVVEPEALAEPAPDDAAPETVEDPVLSPTDAAILEALQIAPEPVEDIDRTPESQNVFREFSGVAPVAPPVLDAPQSQQPDELYLTSLDRSDLSQDAIALPAVDEFATDAPFVLAALPPANAAAFDLDERGLVTPSREGTLNPDGVMVYAGRPPSVPPETPVWFEEEPVVEEPDQRLAGYRPRARPENLVEQFERQQLGGRSLEELAVVRPKIRPASLRPEPEPEIDETPTALAVVRVPRPKLRPARLAAVASAQPNAGTATLGSTARVNNSEDEVGSFQPRTVNPKIPTTASVARQATIDNAINLRKLNLIGVYGTPANRRALVRLPSGRYKKLKVGDRLDGGKVVAIGDSELRYQKRGNNLTLKMPRG